MAANISVMETLPSTWIKIVKTFRSGQVHHASQRCLSHVAADNIALPYISYFVKSRDSTGTGWPMKRAQRGNSSTLYRELGDWGWINPTPLGVQAQDAEAPSICEAAAARYRWGRTMRQGVQLATNKVPRFGEHLGQFWLYPAC